MEHMGLGIDLSFIRNIVGEKSKKKERWGMWKEMRPGGLRKARIQKELLCHGF